MRPTCCTSSNNSILDPALRRHACIESVLDLGHFRNRIGQLDNFGRASPASDNDMHTWRALAQRLQHLLQRQPAVDQGLGQLVEQDHERLASQYVGAGFSPALARKLR
jgi:hypothetical protein